MPGPRARFAIAISVLASMAMLGATAPARASDGASPQVGSTAESRLAAAKQFRISFGLAHDQRTLGHQTVMNTFGIRACVSTSC